MPDRSALPSPAALDRAVTYLATTRTEPEKPHRHLIVRHVHPEWHGHCGDPLKRGWKPCGRPHWHIWWRHTHA